jgi:hypothetical protein
MLLTLFLFINNGGEREKGKWERNCQARKVQAREGWLEKHNLYFGIVPSWWRSVTVNRVLESRSYLKESYPLRSLIIVVDFLVWETDVPCLLPGRYPCYCTRGFPSNFSGLILVTLIAWVGGNVQALASPSQMNTYMYKITNIVMYVITIFS